MLERPQTTQRGWSRGIDLLERPALRHRRLRTGDGDVPDPGEVELLADHLGDDPAGGLGGADEHHVAAHAGGLQPVHVVHQLLGAWAQVAARVREPALGRDDGDVGDDQDAERGRAEAQHPAEPRAAAATPIPVPPHPVPLPARQKTAKGSNTGTPCQSADAPAASPVAVDSGSALGRTRTCAHGSAGWEVPMLVSSGLRESRSIAKRPRQDSNLRTRLRRPMLYPLSYEGGCTPEVRRADPPA